MKEQPLPSRLSRKGTIEEKVISSKADYASGTVVELTAVSAAGWSFDHWEGDLKGSDNPGRITVSSARAVKAVFSKNHYAYNLKIVGPGVVDEYLVEYTKVTLEYATKVLLKAIPADGAIFKGWSGSLNDSTSEVTVDIDDKKELVATFETITHQYPKIDYMLPSVKQKCLYFGIDYSAVGLSNVNCYCPADYDGDGYIDLIVSNTDWSYDGRFPIRFLKGSESGLFLTDEINDNRMLGLNNIRKIIRGDYNGDGVFGTNYTGWAVQIVKYADRGFYDVTESYLSLEDGCEREGNSVYWLDFEDVNGVEYLIGRREPAPYIMFELADDRLTRPQESASETLRPKNGIHIYSEGCISADAINYGCKEAPFAGNTCIKISDWRLWTGFNIPLNNALQNGTDLSYLRDNDYALELYIKNTNPDIEIHFKLNSVIVEEHSDDATFCYAYRGREHNTEGSWERITIPLKDLDEWNKSEDFMKKIDHFNVIICSESGADFYLDEIRIRKILPGMTGP